MRLTRTTLKELSRKYRAVLNRCLLMSMVLGIASPALAIEQGTLDRLHEIDPTIPTSSYTITNGSESDHHYIKYEVASDGTLTPHYYKIVFDGSRVTPSAKLANQINWFTEEQTPEDGYIIGTVNILSDKLYYKAKKTENRTDTPSQKIEENFIANSAENGGAIYNDGGTIETITGDFISNSATLYGGAIYNYGGTIETITGDFISNSAGYAGGAIRNTGTINTLTGDFISNSAITYYGGAIYNDAGTIETITGDFISNSAGTIGGAIENDRGTLGNITGDFTSNSAGHGGAIDNLFGKITSITGNFTSNIAGTNGGAILNNEGTIYSIKGDFIKNSATNGGAIKNVGTIDTLAGDFIGNSAKYGGAILNEGGTVHIVANDKNIKFEGNTAEKGGAIYNEQNKTVGLYAQSGKSISFIGDNSNPETDSIYNKGIINIGGTHNSVNYTGTVSLQKLDNLGKIYVNGGTTILNKVDGDGSGTIDIKDGTVILNNTVENNTLNLNSNGTLKTAARDFTISASINSTKGTLDLKNNAITTTTMSNLTGNLNVLVDVDLSASQMDKINITTNNGGILIKNINLMGTTQQNSLTLDFVNSETFVSSTINNISYNGTNYIVSYDYNTGRLILTKTSALPTPIKKTQDNGVASSVSTNTVVSSVINANRMVYQSRPFSSVYGKKNVQGKSGGDKSQYGLWVEGLYNMTERDSNNADFDAHTKAIAMGLDHQITDSVLAGVGYSYSQSDVKADGNKSDIDTHSVFVYGQYKPKSYFVMGSVGYAFSKTESKVQNTEDYNSNAFFADALVGKEYGLFTPNAGLRYSFVRQDNYKTNGMSVKSKNAQTLTGVVGTKISGTHLVNKRPVNIHISLNALYDLKSENNSVTINRTTTIETKKLSRFGIEAGAGVQAQLSNHWSLNADYVGEFREHYKSNTGIVSVKYDF